MKSKQQSPLWPYLGILACLFVLSITAPRAWNRMARQETLSQMLAARQYRPSALSRHQPRAQKLETVDAAELAPREILHAQSAKKSARTAQSPPPAPPVLTLEPPAPEFAQSVVAPADESKAEPAPDEGPAVDLPRENAVAQSADPSASAAPEYRWPVPRDLVRQLGLLATDDPNAVWAGQAIDRINELCQGAQGNRPAAEILVELRGLLEQGAAAQGSPLEAQNIRAQYALTRWLDIWEPADGLDQSSVLTAEQAPTSNQLAGCLADAEKLAQQGASGRLWREYLQLDALERLDRVTDGSAEAERRAVARKVLGRLESGKLTRAQKKFVDDGPLAALRSELRTWAAEPVASARLLAHLDNYERTSLPSDARLVADDWRGLSWSAPHAAELVSQHLDTHYRNANVRMALSSALVNRLVPEPSTTEAPFRDTVVNVPVSGRNTTYTKLSVRLVPDSRRIRVGLEASGLVSSDAVSTSGPAKFYSEGQSSFLVRKLLVLGPEGLSVWPAIAEAENNYNYLISMETDFDGVPLVGSLVRNIARSQHAEKSAEARFEVEEKVATRARDQLDAEVRPRLVKAAESIEKNQLTTLRRLGLEVTPVALSTTKDRLVARVRLAGPEQLGAHTPRPRAPSDSAISLQVHQSALNNGLEKLDLDGRTFTLDELFAWIAKKLGRPELASQEDLPEDVQLTFAAKDAVHVKCEANRIQVFLSFAELSDGAHRWRNFTISTLYRGEPQGLAPLFTRASPIAASKGVKNRAVLYAIFSKVLSRSRDLRMLEGAITSDPRLDGLKITQFVIEHGWIGLAYGDRRAPASVAHRPK